MYKYFKYVYIFGLIIMALGAGILIGNALPVERMDSGMFYYVLPLWGLLIALIMFFTLFIFITRDINTDVDVHLGLNKWTPNTKQINNVIADKENNINTDDISDGFHTFGQLYHQRMMLFATIVNLFPDLSWKTKRHEDGEECFGGGWFLVTIETPAGAYGYHYRMEDWNKFKCDELEKAKHWDGYTEENVDRLLSLTMYQSLISFINNFVSKKFRSYNKEDDLK